MNARNDSRTVGGCARPRFSGVASDPQAHSRDKIVTPEQGAGLAAHETRHVLQELSPQSYRRAHEIEAYRWQRSVDKIFPLRTDAEIAKFVNTHPLYANVPH